MKPPRAGAILWVAVAVVAAFSRVRADIPPPDYDFNWANITDLNNPAYPGGPPYNVNAGRGSVSYAYRISKFEITSAQWTEFLNMALRQGVNLDNYGLRPIFWGAKLSGGKYSAVEPMRPVVGLKWRAGAYYCNWLNNGKPESWTSCLSGAYDASTFGQMTDGTYTDQLMHSPGAKFWIPTLDEWLKAVHYDPNKNGSGQGGWWQYCYGSDSPPIPGPPGIGDTSGGWDPGDFGELTVSLGAYANSMTPYGLWDASGGSTEWNEEAVGAKNGRFLYRRSDGSYAGGAINPDHIQSMDRAEPYIQNYYGFRIAGQIPSPSVMTVAFVGSAGFLMRRERADRPQPD